MSKKKKLVNIMINITFDKNLFIFIRKTVEKIKNNKGR